MNALFAAGFQTVFLSMLRIVLVAMVAGLLVRRRIISSQDIDALSRVTIHVLLPCLIITSMLTNLDLDAMPFWWALPLASVIMNLGGLLFGWLLFGGKLMENRELIAMSGIQNSAYLVLPVGQAIYPQTFETFATYCFLFVIGNAPIHWTLGVMLVGKDKKMQLKSMLNLPLLASLAGIVLVLLGLNRFVPPLVLDAAQLLGDATIPLATFILGATLGEVSVASLPPWHKLTRLIAAKFVLVPLVTWGVLSAMKIKEHFPLMASLFIIQAAAAPATNLIIQARAYGGRTELLGSAMIICYLACLLAIPFWLTLVAPV